MSSPQKRELTLRRLLEDNFVMAGHCRMVLDKLVDASLKYYYQNIAARRSQFAIELKEEISFSTGKEPYIPSQIYDRGRKEGDLKNTLQIVKKTLKLTRQSLKNYQDALCRIHEGSCREILLRHKAFIENSIFELKSIKTLLKFQNQMNGQLEEERSHS